MAPRTYRIGYSPVWRVIFFLFALLMLFIAVGLVVEALTEPEDGIVLPLSLLIASFFVGLYMLPLIRARRQTLTIDASGLTLSGETSSLVLPWHTVGEARLNPVMPLLPYLVIPTSDMAALVQFLEANPRCFLAIWSRHVRALRRYPWIVRKLFGIPAKMTTATMLEWLAWRYGGAIVIDGLAAGWRAREILAAIDAARGGR